MGFLERWTLRRGAKRYANLLGPALAAAYGASESYSVDQIRTAVSKCGLDDRFIALGFAAFLPDDQFQATERGVLSDLSREDCRALLAHYRPSRPSSAFAEPPNEVGLP